jgi:hypothetical protein
MHETNRGGSILQPLLFMVGSIVLIIYLVGALNTGNWLWVLPIQPTYQPSRILIRNEGNITEYRPGDEGFAELENALNLALADFSNLDLVPLGLSEVTLQEYNESALVMEVFYPRAIRFNTIVRMRNINNLLIPIEGRHAGLRYVFPGSNGTWLSGAFVMADDVPIFDALRTLGYID